MAQLHKLKSIDAAELLQRPFDHDSYESGYRSGMRDGWIACLDALVKGLSAEAYELAFRFWENELRAWKFQEPGMGYIPPTFAYAPLKTRTRRSISLSLRYEVLRRDGSRCQLCGASVIDDTHVRLEVDHKTAASKDGPGTADNLWTLCFECNRGKGTKPL